MSTKRWRYISAMKLGNVFGCVLVMPRIGWYVIVDVRAPSSSAKSESSQSQSHVGIELHRTDDVTHELRREGP